MANKCFIPILGKRIRVTALDNCGNVPEAGGEDVAQVTTDGFISVSLSAETEDGTEIIQKKADGSLCVNEMGDPSFKRFTVEIEFCGVNPELLSLVTNADVYENEEGDSAGIVIPEGTISKRFALELWTGLSGQACEDGVEEASGYIILPFLGAGVLGDVEVAEGAAVTFSLTGAFTRGSNNWGVGPYGVVGDGAGAATVLPTPLDSKDHLLLMETGIAPPPSACEGGPIPALV